MPPPYAVRVRTATGWQDIALTGPPGAQGPTGPAGAVQVYEQAADPGASPSGVVWIDTDDVPPQYGVYRPVLPIVTALPSSPEDGQECYFLADATDGVVWHLRYRMAASGSYKWEFVGGPSLFNEVVTGEATSSTGYTTLTTAGPQVTIPLAGDYDVEIGAAVYTPTLGQGQMSYQVGATAALAADNVQFPGDTSYRSDCVRTKRKTALPAATLISARYLTSAGTANFANRRMRVTPVRVG